MPDSMGPREALPRGPAAARRAANLRDRVFDPGSLVQAERTPYQVIHQQDIIRLRWYPPLAERRIELDQGSLEVRPQSLPVPLVLVAPLAVNMSIYDLFPQRSLVRYLLARGFSLYLVDWGRPQARHDHWRLGTYITELLPDLLERVRAHAGVRPLSLHGWSFGGLFAYCYAAWSGDPDLVNLALVGAPCDYHNNGMLGRQYQLLGRVVRRLGRHTGLRPHALPPRLLRMPGWINSFAYKLTNPVASLRPHLDLLRNLHDRERVAAHATNAAFLDDMVAYPGGVIQDTLQYLWTDNVLAAGGLPIAGCEARLSSIAANLLAVAGSGDPIVTPECARTLLRFPQGADQTFLEVPGGHMAILGGSQAASQVWPAVADWLERRSQG
ncbi:MAG: hypothetical protein P4L83_00210 [Nevskia sp.]|nr:hypothetical protein [Nevskia sp.]